MAFAQWLGAQTAELGLEAIGCLRLDQKLTGQLAEIYSPAELEGMPEYVRRDRQFKIDPQSYAPWAKSVLVALGSFRSLPEPPGRGLFKMSTKDSPVSGLVAGYCLRLDYHVSGRAAMRSLAEALEGFAGHEFRAEAHCDAGPLPERSFALAAGMGTVGLSRALLASATRDGVFIACLLTDLDLPERIFLKDRTSSCDRCGACVSACQAEAIGQVEKHLDCMRCAAALGLEFRGPLEMEQVKSLGLWVAGCGECVRECRRSKMPPPEWLDLDWLLNCPTPELDKAIASTPLEHSGSTMLRRNALAVLRNRNTPEALKLVCGFRDRTGSEKLKDFAGTLASSSF